MSYLVHKASYFLNQSAYIAKLCDPLFKSTGIIGFLFIRIFNDGSVILLCNESQYLDWHLGNEYLITPGMPDEIETDKFIIMSNPEVVPNYNPVLQGLRNVFGYDYPISLVEKNVDYTDTYSFVAPFTSQCNINLYLNSLEILEKFKSHFKLKMAKFLKRAKNYRIYLPDHMWPSAATSKDLSAMLETGNQNNSPYCKDKQAFLDINGNEICLSKQQVEVMNFLSDGFTIKEIGNSMSLSPRTIEHYLEHIKEKFGCFKKSELIKCFKHK